MYIEQKLTANETKIQDFIIMVEEFGILFLWEDKNKKLAKDTWIIKICKVHKVEKVRFEWNY